MNICHISRFIVHPYWIFIEYLFCLSYIWIIIWIIILVFINSNSGWPQSPFTFTVWKLTFCYNLLLLCVTKVRKLYSIQKTWGWKKLHFYHFFNYSFPCWIGYSFKLSKVSLWSLDRFDLDTVTSKSIQTLISSYIEI